MKSTKSALTDRTLNRKQKAAFKAVEDAFASIFKRGYAAGLDAGWIQLALWHATDRVDGLPSVKSLLESSAAAAALTSSAGSAKVRRATRKKSSP